MIVYEVMVEVDIEIAADFEHYMQEKHIPEIFATGSFGSISFDRASGTRFRTRYEARTQEDLGRYLALHASHFRSDFLAHFPTGAIPSREVWSKLKAWA